MSDKILAELIKNQKQNLIEDKKLLFNDFKRLSKHLSKSIFNEKECSLWNKNNYNLYIFFYLNKRKYSLHRLLYYNFIGPIKDSEYIKFYCNNKGICCNIYHIYISNNNNQLNNIPLIECNECNEYNENNIIDNNKYFLKQLDNLELDNTSLIQQNEKNINNLELDNKSSIQQNEKNNLKIIVNF